LTQNIELFEAALLFRCALAAVQFFYCPSIVIEKRMVNTA